jgi:cytochrome P450
MAMCLYPEVQKKAQVELDNVLGGRLPEFNDRPHLPYINAVMKESMRWQQVVPLGVYFPPCKEVRLMSHDLSSCTFE